MTEQDEEEDQLGEGQQSSLHSNKEPDLFDSSNYEGILKVECIKRRSRIRIESNDSNCMDKNNPNETSNSVDDYKPFLNRNLCSKVPITQAINLSTNYIYKPHESSQNLSNTAAHCFKKVLLPNKTTTSTPNSGRSSQKKPFYLNS